MQENLSESRQKRYKIFGSGTERVTAFSDGVFAIAITLLVLTFTPPPFPPNLPVDQVPGKVLELWPRFLSYLISFWTIGMYWVFHHRQYQLIKRIDGRLLWLNLILLLFISFQPFPTSLLAEYGSNSAFVVAFYSAVLGTTGLVQGLVWFYATWNHRLVDSDLDPRLINYIRYRSLAGPVIFYLSAAIAYLSPDAAMYFWLVIVVALRLLGYIFKHETQEENKLDTEEAKV